MTSSSNLAWGAIQGRLEFSESVLNGAAQLAVAHFERAAAEEFSGEAVEDYVLPEWLQSWSIDCLADALKALGFQPAAADKHRLLATVGIEKHDDHIDGPVAIVVLHNDGLTFRQGRQAHVTKVGEWFVFDDRKVHEVRETKKSTSYVCLSIPLKALS